MLTIHPMYDKLTIKAFLGATIDPVLLATERAFNDADLSDLDVVTDIVGMFGSMQGIRGDVSMQESGIVIVFDVEGGTERLQGVSDRFTALLRDFTGRHLQAIIEPVEGSTTGRLLFR